MVRQLSLSPVLTRLLAIASLACLLSAPARAQLTFEPGDLEAGQVLLNFSVNEEVEVEQDTLHARLQYTAQGRDQRALQNEVNGVMAEALALLEHQEGVEVATRHYHVSIRPADRPNRNDISEPIWRAQQSVELSGMDSGLVLELAGQLQELGLHMTGLYYSLSAERRRDVTDNLLEAALERLQTKAERSAAALGKERAELIEVNLNEGMNMPYFAARSMSAVAEDSAVATPVAEPGRSTVTLQISARALLSP